MANVDNYSVMTLPLEMRFGETKLAIGTGFVWEHEEKFYLITNWHNVSGRDPFTGRHLSPKAGEPDRLRVLWMSRVEEPPRFWDEHPLRDDVSGSPLWLVHPKLGHQVDVVALPVEPKAAVNLQPLNGGPTEDLLVAVGMDVFILGYPFGVTTRGLPIWKRGSIASEPQMINPSMPVMLVDSATREGMSGSPVIRRSWHSHAMADGSLRQDFRPATKLVGVYSGRLSTADPNDPQLGLMWPISLVEEIIVGNRRDV